jgi:hypothetical protein
MNEQGLYRVVGVNSKVNKLTQMGLGKWKQVAYNWAWILKSYSHFASWTTLLSPLNFTAVASAPRREGVQLKEQHQADSSTVYIPLPSIQMYSEIPEPSY